MTFSLVFCILALMMLPPIAFVAWNAATCKYNQIVAPWAAKLGAVSWIVLFSFSIASLACWWVGV